MVAVACFLPGRAKDLSAPLRIMAYILIRRSFDKKLIKRLVIIKIEMVLK
jgi:hypothetical protein